MAALAQAQALDGTVCSEAAVRVEMPADMEMGGEVEAYGVLS